MTKSLEEMKQEIYENNVSKGWFDIDRPFSEDLMLLTTEAGEAYETYRIRKMDTYTNFNGKPDDVGSELADILIRLLDTCKRYDVDLEAEYERKMAYNRTRSYRHGGKLA